MNTPITRTPIARTMIALLSTATLAAALALAPPADATSQDISLSTEQGRAGTVRLGQRAAAAGEVVRGSAACLLVRWGTARASHLPHMN
jgi:hypothetical protein